MPVPIFTDFLLIYILLHIPVLVQYPLVHSLITTIGKKCNVCTNNY